MRTRAWAAVNREKYPDLRSAVLAAVHLAWSPLPRASSATVEVRARNKGRRIEARAEEVQA